MKTHSIRTFLFVALWGWSVPTSFAQSPFAVFRQFTTEHGLPSSETYDVLEDRDGYIWIATDNGVSRYDGYRFENFGPEQGLSSPVVLKLYEDYRGRVWFCTMSSKLFYYDKGQVIPYPYNAIIEEQGVRYVKYIHLSKNNVLTVSLPDQGYLEVQPDGTYHHYTHPCGQRLISMDSLLIHTCGFCPTPKWAKHFNIDKTLEIIENGHPTDSIRFKSFRGPHLVFFASLQKEGLIIYATRGSLLAIKNKKFVNSIAADGYIIFLGSDSADRIYLQLQSETGVRVYNSYSELIRNRYAVILEGFKASGLTQDQSDGLWISTLSRGVLYFPTRELTTYLGLPGKPITSLSVKSRFELFAGLQNGNVIFFNEKENPASVVRLPPSWDDTYPVFDLSYDKLSKTLWKGSRWLFEWRDGQWLKRTSYDFYKKHQIQRREPLGNKRITITREGILWGVNSGALGFTKYDIATHHFLYSSTLRMKKQKGAGIPRVPIERTNVVFEDQARHVWVGNVKGLYRFTPEKELIPPSVDHPAFRLRVEDIHEMADSTLVIGTKGGGLLLWKGEKVRSITTRDGLTSDMIERVHVDSAQHIWAGTLNGLNLIRLNGPDSVRVHTYTLADGMPSDEITDIDSYGDQVWVGTTRGLVKMPTRFTRNPFSPAPLLRGMEVNGTFVHRDSLRDLAYNQNNLQVDLLAVNPKMNGRIRYRYRLHAGEDWTYTTDRYLNFPRLRPDAYRLEAQAENEDGVWSASAVLPFTIRPAFWATWWFRGLILLALGALAVLGVRTRIRHLREEAGRRQERAELQRELSELERAALRAQMNPHFLSNCLNSIQGLIVRGEKAEAMRYLAVFHQLLRQTLDLSRKRSVPLEEDVALLRTYLKLEQMRSGIPFRYRIEIDPALDTFELEVPPLLVQPYVENAILHAFPPTVSDPLIEITYRAQPGGLEIAVTDNGIGMEKSRPQRSGPFTKERSYGMDIPRRRLEILTGAAHQVQIEQRKGEGGKILGTRVRLCIPTTDPDRQTDPA